MSEVGADMRKFPDDKHFVSWLGLCPGTKIVANLHRRAQQVGLQVVPVAAPA